MGNAKNLINAAAFNRINRHVEPFLSHGVIFCLVPRPHYYARPMRFGSRGPRKFVSDTSPKCIDREGLKRRRTGLGKGYIDVTKHKHKHSIQFHENRNIWSLVLETASRHTRWKTFSSTRVRESLRPVHAQRTRSKTVATTTASFTSIGEREGELRPVHPQHSRWKTFAATANFTSTRVRRDRAASFRVGGLKKNA